MDVLCERYFDTFERCASKNKRYTREVSKILAKGTNNLSKQKFRGLKLNRDQNGQSNKRQLIFAA